MVVYGLANKVDADLPMMMSCVLYRGRCYTFSSAINWWRCGGTLLNIVVWDVARQVLGHETVSDPAVIKEIMSRITAAKELGYNYQKLTPEDHARLGLYEPFPDHPSSG